MGFNPENWCDDIEDESITRKPVKVIVCTIVRVIQLFSPFVKFIKTLQDIFLEMLFEANFITEILIMLAPIVPIAVMFRYFLDSL